MKATQLFPKSLFAALLLLSASSLFSQKYVVRGALADSLDGALEAATVMLMNPADSSLVAFGRTRADGAFELRNVPAGRHLLRCTYLGYRSLQKMVEAAGAEKAIELGKMALVPNSRALGEAVVSAEASPVRFNKDTIEFRAASFQTQPNATVEDLLKKMPGVEVDREGNIKAQGEEVKNVLVEGKKFFGDDPKMATQNLPADAVEKVQIFDKKSETATFTGVDDGQKEKTINLDLKEEAKNGWFGRLIGGGGASQHEAAASADWQRRFEGKASLNKFTPKTQVSVLGIGNNVNQPGFSIDEYMQYSGAMRQMMGGGGRVSLQFDLDNMPIPLDFGQNEGFLTTWAGGANANREFGAADRKGNLNGSYFYANLGQDNRTEAVRESFLPEGTFVTTSASEQNNLRESHRGQAGLEQKIDSFNSVQLNAAYIRTATSVGLQSSSATVGPNGKPENASARDYASEATNDNLSSDLTLRHKFKKRGRNVAVNAAFSLNRGEAESDNFSKNTFYDALGSVSRRDTLNQNTRSATETQVFGTGATYTEPLGKKRYLELAYSYNRTDNQSDRVVDDILPGNERQPNALLSNRFESQFAYHRAGAGFRLTRKTWNGSVGLDLQAAMLAGEVLSGAGEPVSRRFEHALPRLTFEKEFAQNQRLNANYRSSVTAPTVQQLQPVPDLSDPLNIRLGNPDLKPEYAHNMDVHYSRFNPDNFRSFFVGAFLTLTQNQITDAQNVDAQFVRTFQPENAPLGYQSFVNASLGLPVKKWHSQVNFRSEGRLSESQNRLNGARNRTRQNAIFQSLNWEFTPPGDWLTLSAGAELGWNRARYSLDANFDQDYLTETYSADATVNWPKDFTLASSLNVVRNSGLAEGYDQAVPVWNASVGKFFGAKKRLEITLAARDLLNRNQGIHRSANLNFVEDQRVASLSRYFMLRAVYALNSLGGGQQSGPRMRMMIRR